MQVTEWPLLESSYRPAPISERTGPKIPIVFSADQMPTQVEQVTDGGMRTQEPLSLPSRFELTHPSLPYPGRLVGLLYAIVLILVGTMNHIRYQLSMCNAITAQLVSDDLSGFASM